MNILARCLVFVVMILSASCSQFPPAFGKKITLAQGAKVSGAFDPLFQNDVDSLPAGLVIETLTLSLAPGQRFAVRTEFNRAGRECFVQIVRGGKVVYSHNNNGVGNLGPQTATFENGSAFQDDYTFESYHKLTPPDTNERFWHQGNWRFNAPFTNPNFANVGFETLSAAHNNVGRTINQIGKDFDSCLVSLSSDNGLNLTPPKPGRSNNLNQKVYGRGKSN